ncbi:uncharacterized protein IL334_006800 [Kwoniella shivajii]|uniref:Uncharacterized protein n=1 Tax=Kwoniella shivajii TaxID=564305 RepID=A0ABZ1D8N1_9TREE|nr:hypothetical protein IL334_006800 [Kwoniella shivajii]
MKGINDFSNALCSRVEINPAKSISTGIGPDNHSFDHLQHGFIKNRTIHYNSGRRPRDSKRNTFLSMY